MCRLISALPAPLTTVGAPDSTWGSGHSLWQILALGVMRWPFL